MRVNYEEKTYESYFNSELSNLSEVYFPIGQVQEGSTGFDSSALSNSPSLWRILGYSYPPFPRFRGLEIMRIARDMEHIYGVDLDHIPRIKTNLIFQYKRPSFLKKRNAKEWKHWNEPYYRYNIYKEQQEMLMHIHNNFNTEVLVIYASPAIRNINDLVKRYTEKKVIESSNFSRAIELDGHGRNTYTSSGSHSVACSEPKKLDNFDLIMELKRLAEKEVPSNNESNRRQIKDFANRMKAIFLEDKYFSESFRVMDNEISDYKSYEILYSFLVMRNIRLLTGIQWIIKV